jgi:Gram-negative bacterial TonB protein C-terminal
MNRFLTIPAFLITFTTIAAFPGYAANTRPAMVASGGDSFASQLHYPQKAKAERKQAAIPFYCEIGADGKPTHIHTLQYKGKQEFTDMVDHALRKGRFQPALVDGKPTPVMIGGTVIFMFAGNAPAVVVSLSNADKEKTAHMGNYIQPQMIGSDAEFRRKIFKNRFDIIFQPGEHPSAEAMCHVDAQGNLTGTTLVAEAPPKGGYGTVLLKAFQGAKFIPALNNGTPVAGEFDLPIDFKYMRDPDSGPEVGTQLKDDR